MSSMPSTRTSTTTTNNQNGTTINVNADCWAYCLFLWYLHG
jgi:hypothetical protein